MKLIMRGLALVWALALAGSVAAQPRVFPAKSLTGWLAVAVFPEASINGQPKRFTAGARILDQNNRIVMPASIPGSVAVRYELDGAGQIQRAWMLTDAEIEAARR